MCSFRTIEFQVTTEFGCLLSTVINIIGLKNKVNMIQKTPLLGECLRSLRLNFPS